jgi:hypothetical protein
MIRIGMEDHLRHVDSSLLHSQEFLAKLGSILLGDGDDRIAHNNAHLVWCMEPCTANISPSNTHEAGSTDEMIA